MQPTTTSLPYRACLKPADLAIVVGGYNSSNTSHLVELCEEQLPTFFIEGPDKLISKHEILHFDLHLHEEKTTVRLFAGGKSIAHSHDQRASCPDAIVESYNQKNYAV